MIYFLVMTVFLLVVLGLGVVLLLEIIKWLRRH